MKNVLVTCAGGFQGFSLMESLRAMGAGKIVSISSEEVHATGFYCDYSYRMDSIYSDDYISFIIDKARRHDVKLVIPATPLDLSILRDGYDALKSDGIDILVSSADILQIALDKKHLHRFCIDHGIEILEHHDRIDRRTPFPVLAKNRFESGGKQMEKLFDFGDFERFSKIRNPENFIFQKYVDRFDEYSVDLLFSLESQLLRFLVRKRKQTSGGFSIVSSVEKDVNPELKRSLLHFCESVAPLGAIGFINIQYLETEGRYFLSDFNPRHGTSSLFSLFDIDLSDLYTPGVIEVCTNSDIKTDVTAVRTLKTEIFPRLDLEDIEWIVFDLDDTLFRQKQWFYEKIKAFRNDSLIREAVRILEDANKVTFIDKLVEKHKDVTGNKNDFLEKFRSMIPEGEFLFAGARELLDHLNGNFKLLLLTNGNQTGQMQKIVQSDIERYFVKIIIDGTEEKDFRRICRDLHVLPEKCMMIGNHLITDIVNALQAGFKYGIHVNLEESFSHTFSKEIIAETLGDMKHRYLYFDRLHGLLNAFFLSSRSSSDTFVP